MSLLAFWIGMATLIALDYMVRLRTGLPNRWVSHSIGSVIGAVMIAWGVWLVVGRFGGLRTTFERRRYLLTLAMIILAASWIARRYSH